MNVVTFTPRKPETAKGGVTLFLHVRQTTLIAHLAPPRRHRVAVKRRKQTSRTLR